MCLIVPIGMKNYSCIECRLVDYSIYVAQYIFMSQLLCRGLHDLSGKSSCINRQKFPVLFVAIRQTSGLLLEVYLSFKVLHFDWFYTRAPHRNL